MIRPVKHWQCSTEQSGTIGNKINIRNTVYITFEAAVFPLYSCFFCKKYTRGRAVSGQKNERLQSVLQSLLAKQIMLLNILMFQDIYHHKSSVLLGLFFFISVFGLVLFV